MYNYPFPKEQNYFTPIAIMPDKHSMGDSLFNYLDIKVHPLLKSDSLSTINVTGNFCRDNHISSIEKNDKQFNYMRPTVTISNQTAEADCFPGIDYVYHYSNLIKSYMLMNGKDITIHCNLPSERVCWTALDNSTLKYIPRVDTVIMGYVEGLDFLSEDKTWNGDGNFLYKNIRTKSGSAILLGCKHTFWGEIAGRIVIYLSQLGVKRIIYTGKLGTLVDNIVPNKMLATGSSSILPNGKTITWNNIFENLNLNTVHKGPHITIPSILQESKDWVTKSKSSSAFVDPEIGHMAYASQIMKTEFSYLHIISDNLTTKYPYDLSNERKNEVRTDRHKLMTIIGDAILQL